MHDCKGIDCTTRKILTCINPLGAEILTLFKSCVYFRKYKTSKYRVSKTEVLHESFPRVVIEMCFFPTLLRHKASRFPRLLPDIRSNN
jgi:hypothetical protein